MIERDRHVVLILIVLVTLFSCKGEFPESYNVKLDNAEVIVSGNTIIAKTGKVTRNWELGKLGLLTSSFTTDKTDGIVARDDTNADWYFSFMDSEETAELVGVEVKIDNDEGFVGDFIRTKVEFKYPVSQIGLVYDIWTMPGAPGFRTQVSLKKMNQTVLVNEFSDDFVEQFNLNPTVKKAKAIGYFNDTQHRNKAGSPILKEAEFDLSSIGSITWANAVIVTGNQTGMAVVKESHKCANQQGVNTGTFILSSGKIIVSGTGLDSLHLSTEYQPCWATWSIVYDGNETDAKLAIKQFDRKRYPIDPKRDIYIMSNTWGSGSSGANSKYASREANILAELEVSKELGLDILQVDDGWQGTQYNKWETVSTAVYKKPKIDALLPDNTEYDVYPEGWKNIRKAAKDAGVRLGLWAAWTIPLEDLMRNYELGDFRSYKLDFARLKNYKTLHKFENRIRKFIIKTGHKVRVNWDVTEKPPRIGYYYGREYGNIYLENRKPLFPENVVYHPWLVLRDAWHVAKYTNLNKFQITYQNVDLVSRTVSDAYKYNHDYALAITLMGSPIFFQEIHLLSEEAKETIKPLIEKYKSVRDEMYNGYVFSIGEEPTNSSYSGFQNYNPETNSGYLTIFREVNNKEQSKSIRLYFAENSTLKLTNLITGKSEKKKANETGKVNFEISQAAGFLFYKYEIE